MSDQEKYLDMLWVMWNHLEGTDTDEITKLCVYLAEYYDFDVEYLPSPLYESVKWELGLRKLDNHCTGIAESMAL